ncbi:DUF6308 family protein [Cellulomonas septica]|uniref:DUF4332 domain-containing protein n=1 Tax=Cellulomonas septica TaxID=285080 RepID=A0ABX1JVR1_9CELL|nr:DUF6308 family protein [Cellulomonas septica]NKY38147.1 hypothetical protein [Cellulomonas septica]
MITPSARLAWFLDPNRTDEAADVLRRYFTPRPEGQFSGAHFERLGGGGDRPAIANEFTAEDLVAVSMLSVDIGGDAALEILLHRRNRLHELLRQVSTDVSLASLPADSLGADWPVRAIYSELLAISGIGDTAASKLLARKRPHLVPVFDSVVDAELSLVKRRLWLSLHDWLNADGGANATHLATLRGRAGLGHDISLLRVFDVLTWMVGKGYATPSGRVEVP